MNFRSLLCLIALSWLVVSCASATPMTGPDGSPHQLIRCNVINDCYEKATEVCGKYKIVNTTAQQTSDGSDITLLVKCGG